MREEGEPGCMRGLASVLCSAVGRANLQKGFPGGAEASALMLEGRGPGLVFRRAMTNAEPVFLKD